MVLVVRQAHCSNSNARIVIKFNAKQFAVQIMSNLLKLFDFICMTVHPPAPFLILICLFRFRFGSLGD